MLQLQLYLQANPLDASVTKEEDSTHSPGIAKAYVNPSATLEEENEPKPEVEDEPGEPKDTQEETNEEEEKSKPKSRSSFSRKSMKKRFSSKKLKRQISKTMSFEIRENPEGGNSEISHVENAPEKSCQEENEADVNVGNVRKTSVRRITSVDEPTGDDTDVMPPPVKARKHSLLGSIPGGLHLHEKKQSLDSNQPESEPIYI